MNEFWIHFSHEWLCQGAPGRMGIQGDPGISGYEVRERQTPISSCDCVILANRPVFIHISAQNWSAHTPFLSLQGHRGPQGPIGPPGPKGEKVILILHFANEHLNRDPFHLMFCIMSCFRVNMGMMGRWRVLPVLRDWQWVFHLYASDLCVLFIVRHRKHSQLHTIFRDL